jgi:hypothetical protein
MREVTLKQKQKIYDEEYTNQKAPITKKELLLAKIVSAILAM